MGQTIADTNLPATIILPDYDRSLLKSRIVHLGFGAFHRAHQAVFTDSAARQSGSDWGICEISLFSDTLIKALRIQDHLFSVTELGAKSTQSRVIGAVTESLHAGLDGIQSIIEKMAEPQVAIVSLTITEKGYCIDPSTGQLDRNNQLLVADLTNPTEPQSALGFIVQALKLRRERGLQPFTVLSCDNIQGNGQVTKTAIVEFATHFDRDLGAWIADNVSFPGTMVDRIVPAVTTAALQDLERELGVADPCGVACEPFNQWVIEDDFVAGRPVWEIAGAEFVDDVAPFEEMKLRMLNGAHSFLAYLGFLAGHTYISDTMADPGFRNAAFDLMMTEQAPSLKMNNGTKLEAYANRLIERFANPALRHKTWQIAMDGSQKIPQRFGGSLRHHVHTGTDFKFLAAGIAGWIRYVSGTDENGSAIDVRDPMASELAEIYKNHGHNGSVVPAILSVKTIFEPEIGGDTRVINEVTTAYESLLRNGAKATVASLSRDNNTNYFDSRTSK